MKKLKFMFIIFMVAVITGCSAPAEKGIELSNDNLDDYLEISISVSPSGSRWSDAANDYYHTALSYTGEINGASSNYDYSNISLVIKTTVVVNWYQRGTGTNFSKTLEETWTLDLNVGGNGYFSDTIKTGKLTNSTVDYFEDIIQKNYEIVSVSGTVQKIK